MTLTQTQEAASACSACRAVDKPLSRCSQCKWAAYCSKSCQRDHWRVGHRRWCARLRTCQRFRELERRWWASRPADELQTFVGQSGLQPEAMCFFGEVLFLLSGLKACVLLSNLPRTWRQSFADEVVRPCGLLQPPPTAGTAYRVELLTVGTRLETPAEYELTGELVLANSLHAAFPLAQRRLHLADLAVPLAATQASALVVQEHDLARVLDYPVALSECAGDAMQEVGYFLADERVLLASYCASKTDEHGQRVQRHFQQYQLQLQGAFRLELHTSQI